MHAQPHPISQYVDRRFDFETIRAQAAARGRNGGRHAVNLKPPIDVTLIAAMALGLAACVVVAAALASTPANRAVSLTSHDGSSFSEQIKRNAEALKRSRTWWEGYGQRHLHPRRSADRSVAVAD
jgi:hypothetical protein